MKQLIIKSLELQDFKGQNRVFTPNEHITRVFAKNETGKTKLYEAFAWLLCGYTDAVNPKNFALYDITKPLTHETPKARVIATISIDGVDYSLERSACAKFVRQRATNEYIKASSDTYEIRIDGVVTSASMYDEWVTANICDSNLLPYLLIGERFANLALSDKSKARKVLEVVSGGVSMDNLKGDYSNIAEDMKKFSIEQLKERYKAQIIPLTRTISDLEMTLTSKREQFKCYDKKRVAEIEQRISILQGKLDDINDQLTDASASLTPVIEKRNAIIAEIDDIEEDIRTKEREWNECYEKRLFEARKVVNTIYERNKAIVERNKDIQNNINVLQDAYNIQKSESDKTAELLRQNEKERATLVEKVFVADVCPTCGQELPNDMLEKSRKSFLEQKKKDLAANKAERDALEARYTTLKSSMDNITESIENNAKNKGELLSIDEANANYKAIEESCVPFEETDEYKLLRERVNILKENMPALVLDTEDLTNEALEIQKELKELYVTLGEYNFLERLGDDITKLEEKKKEECLHLVEIESRMKTISDYEEEKANIVSDRINGLLTYCQIEMYSRQKNGELQPNCVVLDSKGVPYATTNNANRLNAAISLQRLFCLFAGISVPLFVDEASIFDSEHLPAFEDTQCIYLYASDDEEMKIV